MLDIDITKLAAVWGKAPLKINTCQCLPLRSPKSICRLCVEHCPVAAIELKQDSIKIADNRCTGCGICFNLCPTGVYEMTNLYQDAFLETARHNISKTGTVKIECYKIPFEYSLPKAVRVPCLAHITPGLILKLMSLGVDEVMIRGAGICAVCESRCGDKIARDTVSKTQKLLEAIGLKKKASITQAGISINNLIYEGERLKDYKDDPNLSRRQIFSLFKKEAKKGVAGIIKNENTLKIEGKERLKKAMPKQRDNLLKAIEGFSSTFGNRSITSSIFPAVTINNGCNMCRLCVLFCPTDALAIEDTEKGAGIVFKTATCTGCNLCVDVCAEKAVALDHKEVFMEDIVKRNKIMLIWFDNVCCSSCGKVFAKIKKIKAENICDVCLKERDIF